MFDCDSFTFRVLFSALELHHYFTYYTNLIPNNIVFFLSLLFSLPNTELTIQIAYL